MPIVGPRYARRLQAAIARRHFLIPESFGRGNPPLPNPLLFVNNTEERRAKDHPWRALQRQADEVLQARSRKRTGLVQRPSATFATLALVQAAKG